MYQLIVKPGAERDLQHAFVFYEDKRIGLGYELIGVIEATVMQIQRNPLAFQVKYKNIRRSFTKRFPFGVFYIVEGKNIYILGFLHTSMEEDIWKNRSF